MSRKEAKSSPSSLPYSLPLLDCIHLMQGPRHQSNISHGALRKSLLPVVLALTRSDQDLWILVSADSHIPIILYLLILSQAFFYPQESDEAVAFHKSMAMESRLTEVQDIAPIVSFLCTSGQWITGQTIFANGGYTTR